MVWCADLPDLNLNCKVEEQGSKLTLHHDAECSKRIGFLDQKRKSLTWRGIEGKWLFPSCVFEILGFVVNRSYFVVVQKPMHIKLVKDCSWEVLDGSKTSSEDSVQWLVEA